jgi:hypothetical protein
VRFVPALVLAVALYSCAGSGGPAAEPVSSTGTLAPSGSGDPTGGGPLPDGITAAVSVRGESYEFTEAGTSTCIVAPSLVTVIASLTDPRLTLTITWRAAGGTRHMNFGNPAGRLGIWQAGDNVAGASDVAFVIDGRTATFIGPMRHTDQALDEATIEVSC